MFQPIYLTRRKGEMSKIQIEIKVCGSHTLVLQWFFGLSTFHCLFVEANSVHKDGTLFPFSPMHTPYWICTWTVGPGASDSYTTLWSSEKKHPPIHPVRCLIITKLKSWNVPFLRLPKLEVKTPNTSILSGHWTSWEYKDEWALNQSRSFQNHFSVIMSWLPIKYFRWSLPPIIWEVKHCLLNQIKFKQAG